MITVINRSKNLTGKCVPLEAAYSIMSCGMPREIQQESVNPVLERETYTSRRWPETLTNFVICRNIGSHMKIASDNIRRQSEK